MKITRKALAAIFVLALAPAPVTAAAGTLDISAYATIFTLRTAFNTALSGLGSGDVLTVTGTCPSAVITSSVTLDIPEGATVKWAADYVGDPFSYLMYL